MSGQKVALRATSLISVPYGSPTGRALRQGYLRLTGLDFFLASSRLPHHVAGQIAPSTGVWLLWLPKGSCVTPALHQVSDGRVTGPGS
jgi:hypothetical protein